MSARIVAVLDSLDASDPTWAHGVADGILLALAPPEIQDAYKRLVIRCGGYGRWAGA